MTNATFYDYRESDTVKAIQIDVGKFNNWLTNNASSNYWNGSAPHIGATNIIFGGTNRGGYQYNQLNTYRQHLQRPQHQLYLCL